MTENGRPSKNGVEPGPAAPDEAEPAPPAEASEEAPDAPAAGDVHGVPDATLGGYFGHHDRPPAFEGADGQPYTVSIEIEKTADLAAPYHGYLVFPRWAETGLGIVGHLETPTLFETRSREAAVSRLEELSLDAVKRLLDEAVRARDEDSAGDDHAGGPSRTAKDHDAP